MKSSLRILFVLLAALPAGLQAGLLTSTSTVCDVPPLGSTTHPQSCSQIGTIPDPILGKLPFATADASAVAEYGSLFAGTKAAADHGGSSEATAEASFSDVLTIFGSSGMVELSFAGFNICLFCPAIQQLGMQVNNVKKDLSATPFAPATLIVPFTHGVPFSVGASIGIRSFSMDSDDTFNGSYTFNVSVRLLSKLGSEIKGASYRSESNAAYNINAAAVPEPATALYLVMLAPVAALALRARRRNRVS